MAALSDLYNLHGDGSQIRNRVTAAIALSAWQVLLEDAPDSKRMAWAKNALINAETIAESWMWAVLTQTDALAEAEKANFTLPDEVIIKIVDILRDKFAI